MTNVVTGAFRRKEEIVFCCLYCSGQAWWIDDDGTCTCRTCKMKQALSKEWLEKAIKVANENGNQVDGKLIAMDEEEVDD